MLMTKFGMQLQNYHISISLQMKDSKIALILHITSKTSDEDSVILRYSTESIRGFGGAPRAVVRAGSASFVIRSSEGTGELSFEMVTRAGLRLGLAVTLGVVDVRVHAPATSPIRSGRGDRWPAPALRRRSRGRALASHVALTSLLAACPRSHTQ